MCMNTCTCMYAYIHTPFIPHVGFQELAMIQYGLPLPLLSTPQPRIFTACPPRNSPLVCSYTPGTYNEENMMHAHTHKHTHTSTHTHTHTHTHTPCIQELKKNNASVVRCCDSSYDIDPLRRHLCTGEYVGEHPLCIYIICMEGGSIYMHVHCTCTCECNHIIILTQCVCNVYT